MYSKVRNHGVGESDQYQLCLNFFKLEDAGRVLVRGVKDKGDIKNTDALNKAFELGQEI